MWSFLAVKELTVSIPGEEMGGGGVSRPQPPLRFCPPPPQIYFKMFLARALSINDGRRYGQRVHHGLGSSAIRTPPLTNSWNFQGTFTEIQNVKAVPIAIRIYEGYLDFVVWRKMFGCNLTGFFVIQNCTKLVLTDMTMIVCHYYC